MSDEPSHCPHCNADFQGEPIPQEYRDEGYYGTATHFSRLIGVYNEELDCTTHWRCPDCGKDIPRPGWEKYAAAPGWAARMDAAFRAMVEKNGKKR